MPAVRGKNLRSGDVSLQLSVVLLQSLSLVAPVPRTEDVGIDVVTNVSIMDASYIGSFSDAYNSYLTIGIVLCLE